MGNLKRHGIEMYRQTINLKNNPLNSSETLIPSDTLTVNIRSIPNGELLKTTKNLKEETTFLKKETKEPKDSKYRKVAKFLILIGSEQAAGILAELDPDQVSEISKEIALIRTIKPEERDEILEEFHNLFSRPYSYAGSSRGGVETARRILYAAKGPDKGEELLNKAVPESRENVFGFLEEFSPEQLVMVLKNETSQTTALILSRLSPKLSAGTLSKLPPSCKPDVLKRMVNQGDVLPEVLENISMALKEKVRHISGGANDIEIDGMQTLAAILKQGDYSFGDRILNELEEEDPKIGKDLKEKLYTLDDVINAVDRPIQDKLKTMAERDIAVLLKGRSQEFNEKILSCVSAGRRKLIREEFEILGAIPKRECDAAAREFLAWFRFARERGDIILLSDEDVFL